MSLVRLALSRMKENPLNFFKEDASIFNLLFPYNFKAFNTGHRLVHAAYAGDQSAQPLVFIHGSPGSWEGWSNYLLNPTLQKRFSMLAPDRLGYGGSQRGGVERSLGLQAKAIAELIKEHFSHRPAILVGHSFGGPIAAKLALMYPRLVEGVVFVASSIDPNLEKAFWYQKLGLNPFIRNLIPNSLSVCNEEILALQDELVDLSLELLNWTLPVAVVHGTKDALVPVENVDFIKNMIVSDLIMHSEILQNADHSLPWKNSAAIIEAIESISKE